MVVIKPRCIELREKGKRFKYSEGAVPSTSKSGVKKTLLVGVLPFTQENYTNVKLILGWDGWVDDIAKFCASFRNLDGISFPPKFHMVESHLEQFLRRKWAQNTDYDGFGLGYWSEQQFEAVHHRFTSTWDRFKVGKDHEEYGQRLLTAAMRWDARET